MNRIKTWHRANILASGGFMDAVGGVKGLTTAATGVGTNIIQNVTGDKPKAPKAPVYDTANDVESLFALGQQYQDIDLGRRSGFLGGLSSGLSGAASGLAAGPWGALAGGIAGIAGGLFGAAKYNRAAKREEDKYRRVAGSNFDAQNNVIENNNVANTMMNYAANGGQFDNGLTEFNEGGIHELNPNGGIPQGIGANGKPNVVEQGETKYDDYIFSDRLGFGMVNPQEFRLPSNLKNKTFANASKYLGKESKERPYDPISNNGLKANLSRLREAQEETKELDNIDAENQEVLNALGLDEQTYAKGGNIHIKKSKRGTFTAAATKHGMGVQAFARKVLANKDKYSSAMVKKANFARNSTKWRHAFGGELFDNINGYATGGVMWRPTNNRFVILDGKVNKFAVGNPIDVKYPNSSYSPGFIDAPVDPPIYGTINNRARQYSTPQVAPVAEPIQRINPIGAANTALGSTAFTPKLPTINPTTIQNNIVANNTRMNTYKNNARSGKLASALRYAPILTNLGMTISDMFQEPEVMNLQRISAPQRGRYAQMEYFDRNPIINAMNRRTNTTIDTLKNASAGNRATFMANAALTGNRAQQNVGDLMLKIREDEANRRLQTLGFNNKVDETYDRNRLFADQYNSRIDMQEQQINAMNRAARRNSIREGLSTFGTSLGQIGNEDLTRQQAGFMFGYDPITGRPLNRSAKGGKLSRKRGK